ncbi:hypothetical protein D3C77_467430 [compost metagenome]
MGRSRQYALSMAGSPGRRPERPSLCLRLATEGGQPICATVLMLPMSIPSSRVVVHTAEAGGSPAFNARSASWRSSLDKLPWCGQNSFGTPSFSHSDRRRSANHSTSWRLLGKIRLLCPLNTLYRWPAIATLVPEVLPCSASSSVDAFPGYSATTCCIGGSM